MAALLKTAERFARTTQPVLILGEPGTGKTELAQHIHHLSGRSGPFLKVNVASLPPHLELSHLAGHVRGAFTGAQETRSGFVEAAHRGTLFLDELANASSTLQQILLELLDEGTLRRVGEVRSRPLDVRLMAATNADLDAMVRAGTFRLDLLQRFG